MDEDSAETDDKNTDTIEGMINYLKDLSNRLMHIPVKYGVDGWDVGEVARCANNLKVIVEHEGSENFNSILEIENDPDL